MLKNKIEIYGYFGTIKLFYYLFKTKIFFPEARLIRFPIEVRGRKFIDFGNELTTGVGCRIEAYPFKKKEKIIKFGINVEINDYVHIAAIEGVFIGNDVLIASKVYISDIQHGTYSGDNTHDFPTSIPKMRALSSKPVIIEDKVWIGENVSIMPGVKIGTGSIIGANSIVTKSIPENSIAVGNPARVIKVFNIDKYKWENQ